MAKNFFIVGLKKRRNRGNSFPTVIKRTIKADSEGKAKELFEKENSFYDAVKIETEDFEVVAKKESDVETEEVESIPEEKEVKPMKDPKDGHTKTR